MSTAVPYHTREEFERLFAEIMKMAYGSAIHLTRNRDDAEDLLQEATLLSYSAFSQFKQGTNFRAWYFKIMLNCFRNSWRKRKREPETQPIDDAPDLFLFLENRKLEQTNETSDPALQVLEDMSVDQITQAIYALPEEFRFVCSLYFLEELRYEEIALIAEVPIGTVRSRLHRGRKLLQKALWNVAKENGLINERQ